MGNNTSTGNFHSSGLNKRQGNSSDSIRKSSASVNYNNSVDSSSDNRVRKSTANKNANSLDEEFSDLILHQVVKNSRTLEAAPLQPLPKGEPTNPHHQQSNVYSTHYNQFSDDLIEDEFNELNEGIVETEMGSLQRNIIPDQGFGNDPTNTTSSSDSTGTYNYSSTLNDDMEIDAPFPHDDDDDNDSDGVNKVFPQSRSRTPTPDLTKVDFTKIISQAPPGYDGDTNMNGSGSVPPPTQMMSAASVARNAHSPLPNSDHHQKNLQQQRQPQQQQQLQLLFPDNSCGNTHAYPQQHGRPTKILKTNQQLQQFLIPIEIKWVNTTKEAIHKIAIIGSFSNWRDVIKMYPSTSHPNEFVTTINLPLGVHKLLYIINNEYRVSDQLPTATDQEGIFFNWFEVIDDTHLFNHSLNQPNHIGASTDYDANIIRYDNTTTTTSEMSNTTTATTTTTPKYVQPQTWAPRPAGKSDVDKINQKETDLLYKMSKEASGEFEHVEFIEDTDATGNGNGATAGTAGQSQDSSTPQGHNNHEAINSVDEIAFDNNPYQNYELSTSSSSFLQTTGQIIENPVEYSSEIPEMFINYDYFKMKPADYELPEPPQLPPHLNNVLLNKMTSSSSSSGSGSGSGYSSTSHGSGSMTQHLSSIGNVSTISGSLPKSQSLLSTIGSGSSSSVSNTGSYLNNKRPPLRRADSSYYASNKDAYHLLIPNHVILNHLMTTSIKNDVLTVACITRYLGKFVTQIIHSPADTK